MAYRKSHSTGLGDILDLYNLAAAKVNEGYAKDYQADVSNAWGGDYQTPFGDVQGPPIGDEIGPAQPAASQFGTVAGPGQFGAGMGMTQGGVPQVADFEGAMNVAPIQHSKSIQELLDEIGLGFLRSEGNAGDTGGGHSPVSASHEVGVAMLAALFCWCAAAHFDWFTPTWFNARNWIAEEWPKRSVFGRIFLKAYIKYGESFSHVIRRNRLVKWLTAPFFNWAARKGAEQ